MTFLKKNNYFINKSNWIFGSIQFIKLFCLVSLFINTGWRLETRKIEDLLQSVHFTFKQINGIKVYQVSTPLFFMKMKILNDSIANLRIKTGCLNDTFECNAIIKNTDAECNYRNRDCVFQVDRCLIGNKYYLHFKKPCFNKNDFDIYITVQNDSLFRLSYQTEFDFNSFSIDFFDTIQLHRTPYTYYFKKNKLLYSEAYEYVPGISFYHSQPFTNNSLIDSSQFRLTSREYFIIRDSHDEVISYMQNEAVFGVDTINVKSEKTSNGFTIKESFLDVKDREQFFGIDKKGKPIIEEWKEGKRIK